MSRSWRESLVLRSVGVGAGVVLMASCGARTGLLVPDDIAPLVDGSPPIPDASADVVEEAVGCTPGTFVFAPARPQIMFVFDRSRSMLFELDSDNPAGAGQPSRWSALHDALSQTLSPFSSDIAMGARFFPVVNAGNNAPGACEQDPDSSAILPALDNVQAILNVFDTTQPAGGTPSAGALALASQVSGSRSSVARAMVIATDGAPNCNANLDPFTCTCTAPVDPGQPCAATGERDGSNCLDDQETIQTIQQIYSVQNIPVFVVGIGALGNFETTLDQMAVAGGRPRDGEPRYYPAETPADLTTAFEAVRDSVAKCSYVTPSAPTDPNSITVTLNGATIPHDTTHTDGWDWVDKTFGQLQLFGPACNAATTANVGGTVVCDASDANDQ